jgi:hypothetical protein
MIKLKSLLTEEDVVKNKKTGNVYVVKTFDPSKHDKPTPAEVDKAKAANNGQLPKGEPQPKKTPQNTAPTKKGQKLCVHSLGGQKRINRLLIIRIKIEY